MALPKLEVPTYTAILPSSGKEITFRPFLVKEHKILLSISEASSDEVVRVVKELIDVCTFNKLKINDLPHFDIEYLFMQLRAKSIGENVEVIVTCGNCEEKYEHTFSIDDLKVEKKEVKNHVRINETVSIEFRYPKFENVIELLETSDPEKILEVVRNCMVGVYNGEEFFDVNDQTSEEVDEFLMSLTKEQFDNIEKFFEDSPKIVQEFDSSCPSCNNVNHSRVEGIQNFFV